MYRPYFYILISKNFEFVLTKWLHLITKYMISFLYKKYLMINLSDKQIKYSKSTFKWIYIMLECIILISIKYKFIIHYSKNDISITINISFPQTLFSLFVYSDKYNSRLKISLVRYNSDFYWLISITLNLNLSYTFLA